MRREAEIDTKLGELWNAAREIDAKLDSTRISIAHALNIRGEYHGRSRTATYPSFEELLPKAEAKIADETTFAYDRTRLFDLLTRWNALVKEYRKVRTEAQPLEAIYAEERWSRFFLVQNTNGHIHSSMGCSTCRFDTRFSWLPDLSGLTEKDAVDAHGALLCTVCFPTAPVEWTNFYETQAAERAAARAATECPGSRTHDHDSSGLMYCQRRARCNHCGQTVSVTSTGKLRGHKKEAA